MAVVVVVEEEEEEEDEERGGGRLSCEVVAETAEDGFLGKEG